MATISQPVPVTIRKFPGTYQDFRKMLLHNEPFGLSCRPFASQSLMPQYAYTLRRVGKLVPPKRQILKNISLNFFAGAKSGLLGLKGSGKSTLLKTMAGRETSFAGEGMALPHMQIG